SVSAASAVSPARITFRAAPPATGVKRTRNVPHDSWPMTASQSAPSSLRNRRIRRAPRAALEVESQARAQRPIVCGLTLDVELRGAMRDGVAAEEGYSCLHIGA